MASKATEAYKMSARGKSGKEIQKALKLPDVAQAYALVHKGKKEAAREASANTTKHLPSARKTRARRRTPVPPPVGSVDPETGALQVCLTLLKPLDADAKKRIVTYLYGKFGQ